MSKSVRGLPAIRVEIQTSTQAWKLIEQDYTLRLSLVAHGWAEEHLKAWNAVFAEGRRRNNAAYWAPALVAMEIADIDRRADWAYKTCCEIWEIQGRTQCRLFYRAVFESCLQPLVGVREGCFRSGVDLHQKRTNAAMSQSFSAIFGHMRREIDRLRAKWNTTLEIATRDAENQVRLKKEREHEDNVQAMMIRVKTLIGQELPRQHPSAPIMRKTQKAKKLSKRTTAIFGAIQSNLKGPKYCALLDGRKVRPPESWIEEGCPNSYVQAYRDVHWRKRIQDEKHRQAKKYEITPARELDAIIQGERNTRRTRR